MACCMRKEDRDPPSSNDQQQNIENENCKRYEMVQESEAEAKAKNQTVTKASNGSNVDFNPTYEDSSSAEEYAGQRTTPVQAACFVWKHNRKPSTQHRLSTAADLSPVK